MKDNHQIPLVVDLDGTLIRTDLFFEASLVYIFKNPFRIFKMIYWFLKKGRGYLKLQIEKHVPLNVSCMPWNMDVISWLKKERETGRPLVLVTGATQNYAQQVALHLNLFSKVFGVNRTRMRLSGKNKGRFLYQLYGYQNFDYIANSHFDYPVWKLARSCMVAYAFPFVVRKAQKLFNVVQVFPQKKVFLFQKLKNLSAFMIHVLFKRVHWYSCVLQVVSFLLVIFYFQFFKNLTAQPALIFHVLIGCFLFFISSWFLGEMVHLYSDRIQKNQNLFFKIHPYYGACFIPIFLISILYSLLFLKNFLWIGAFIFFALESLRFLFRFRSHLYEVLICLYLAVYAGMVMV